jgi:hypothetical protein
VVFVVIVALGDIERVGEELVGFAWELVPLILACTLFNYLLRFIKWHYYLGLVGAHDISLKESARIFVAGFPLAVTPGKAGEALKGSWLNQTAGIPTAKGVTVVLAERVSDGLAVLVLSSLGVIAYRQYWPIFSVVAVVLIGVIVLSQFRPGLLALSSEVDTHCCGSRHSRLAGRRRGDVSCAIGARCATYDLHPRYRDLRARFLDHRGRYFCASRGADRGGCQHRRYADPVVGLIS